MILSHATRSLVLLLLLSISGAAFAQQPPTSGRTATPAAEKKAGFVMPEVSEQLMQSGSEAEISAKLVELISLMPESLRSPEGMTIDQLHTLVDTAIALSRVHEQRFPEGEGRKTWIAGVARLYVVNNTRFFVSLANAFKEQTGRNMTQEEMVAQRGAYWDLVIGKLHEALAVHTEKSPENLQLLATLGQACWFSQRYPEAIGAYQKLLNDYPESERRAEFTLALLNAHLSGRSYDVALRHCDDFLKQFPIDELAPHVYQLKAKALLEAGRAREALVWWQTVIPRLLAGATGMPVQVGETTHIFEGEARKSFRRYADEGLFMIGFLHGYLGEFEKAREAFERALADLNEQGDGIDPRSAVFRSRTEKVYEAYMTLVEKEVPNFDIEFWLDSIPFDTAQEQGNVQVLAFLPYENPRYYEFLAILQNLYTDHWHEGLRITWLADPKGFNDTAGQIPRLSAQRESVALGFPIGLETERGWPNFRKFQASVGGGTLIVVNRAGEVVWYKMDPTYRDENLVKGLVRRLLDETP